MQMGFFGIIPFAAPYLPWVLLVFSMLIDNPIETDLLGIIVGHIYYFLESVYPHVARARGWKREKLLVTPHFLHYLCGTVPPGVDREIQVRCIISTFPLVSLLHKYR